MENSTQTSLQAKIFDFALTELVLKNRESFKPLWTVDSWVKFLIWIALNCGLSGERESLEFFAEALGAPLSSRMRRIFFERKIETMSIQVIADPAEPDVLVMATSLDVVLNQKLAEEGIKQVGLIHQVVHERQFWKDCDGVIAIPWKSFLRN